jgi:threonine dehydrogenase-like Zn-dependent dehydrogenase
MTSRGIFGRKLLDIEVRERELGSPGPGQVIVKVRACGVCGTDVNFVRDWTGEPMPLGHEIAAEVVEVGPGVTRLAPADRVIVEDCSMCGTCEHCKAGHPGLCRTMFTLDGQPGMGELLLVPHNSLVKFDGLDFPEASLTEPLAVSLTSVLNADIPLGGSVLVFGNGPLGLMSALLARMRGAGFVAIAGRGADTPLRAARRAAAEKASFDMVLTGSVGDLKEKIHSRFPAGVDRVIVSSPPASIQDALALIRFGGIITFYGLHLGGANVLPVDINDLVFRKISLIPTFAEPAVNFPVSIQLLREGRIDHRAIISHTFGFSSAKEILRGIVEGTLPAVKPVMVF